MLTQLYALAGVLSLVVLRALHLTGWVRGTAAVRASAITFVILTVGLLIAGLAGEAWLKKRRL